MSNAVWSWLWWSIDRLGGVGGDGHGIAGGQGERPVASAAPTGVLLEVLGGWVWRGQVVLGIVQALSRRASPRLCSPFEVDRADPQALPQPVASQTSVAHPTVMVVGDQPSDAALDHRPATVVELVAAGADAGATSWRSWADTVTLRPLGEVVQQARSGQAAPWPAKRATPLAFIATATSLGQVTGARRGRRSSRRGEPAGHRRAGWQRLDHLTPRVRRHTGPGGSRRSVRGVGQHLRGRLLTRAGRPDRHGLNLARWTATGGSGSDASSPRRYE